MHEPKRPLSVTQHVLRAFILHHISKQPDGVEFISLLLVSAWLVLLQVPCSELGAVPDPCLACIAAEHLHRHCSALPGWPEWAACQAPGVGLWHCSTGGHNAVGARRWRASQRRLVTGLMGARTARAHCTLAAAVGWHDHLYRLMQRGHVGSMSMVLHRPRLVGNLGSLTCCFAVSVSFPETAANIHNHFCSKGMHRSCHKGLQNKSQYPPHPRSKALAARFP